MSIIEDFENSNLVPTDTEGLDLIFEKLTEAGLQPQLAPFGAVVVSLKQFGHTHLRAIYVSAREIFYENEELLAASVRRRASRDETLFQKFRPRQSYWANHFKTEYSGNDFEYIVIVDLDGRTKDQYASLASQIELDTLCRKKFICNLESMTSVMVNPFPIKTVRPYGPVAYYSRDTQYSFEEPVADFESVTTAQFNPQDLFKLIAELETHPQAAELRSRAEHLFGVIMGNDYLVVSGSEWPEIQRKGMSSSMPLDYLSSGEKLVMAYCLFLTLQHVAEVPDQCIGIKNGLTGLDAIRKVMALDCLSHFLIATGASVYIRADVQDYVNFARRKLDTALGISKTAPK